jgi:hypothetical protein
MGIHKNKIRFILLFLIISLWVTSVTYFIIRFTPTGKAFQSLIFIPMLISFCLYRLIGLPLLMTEEYKFLQITLPALFLSGIEYVIFDIQRPYSLVLWAIGWQIFAIILAFRFMDASIREDVSS